MNGKYKYIIILLCLLSVAAIIISIVALCMICPRASSLNFDYLGLIIGVLSLLVTVLIGWNIYSILDIENFKLKINSKIKEAQKEPNGKIYKSLTVIYDSLATIYKTNVLKQCGISKFKTEDYEVYYYLQYSLYAIKYFCKIRQYEDNPLPDDYPDKWIKRLVAITGAILKKRDDFMLQDKNKRHIEKLCFEISGLIRDNKSFEELTEKIKSIPIAPK